MVQVGLEAKRDAESRALSGGMKRKLSIAIALIGGSKVGGGGGGGWWRSGRWWTMP